MSDKDRKRKPEAADDGASAPVEQKKKKKYGDKKERKNPVPQSHKEQKELRKKRKEEENPNHALVVRLKELWEGLRVKSGTAEVREKTVDEILELIHGKAKEVIFQHDSARIVQSAIKYGTMAQRAKLFQEVKEHIVELCKSKYSRHVVPKLLQFSDRKTRAAIIQCFYGKVRKLVRHTIAAKVLDEAYGDYATAAERQSLIEEFYGPQYALFKTPERRTIQQIIEAHPDREEKIRKNMYEMLIPLLEKGKCTHTIVHRVLLDFLLIADDKRAAEVVDLVKELVVEMLHTKEGARVAMMTIWKSPAKDRKAILRTFKPYIMKIANEEYGHMVLLSVFDSVDDTVLVRKTVIATLADNFADLASSPQGRKVLLYLLARRSTKHFQPGVLDRLREGDGNTFSKKEPEVRAAELRSAIVPAALDWANENAAEEIVSNGLFLVETLCCEGDKKSAFRAIAKAAVQEEEPLLEDGAGHRLLKVLIQRTAAEDAPFAEELWRAMDDDVIRWAESNRSAFVLLSLLEHGTDGVKAEVKAALAPGVESLAEMADKKGCLALAELVGGSGKSKKAAAKKAATPKKTATKRVAKKADSTAEAQTPRRSKRVKG